MISSFMVFLQTDTDSHGQTAVKQYTASIAWLSRKDNKQYNNFEHSLDNGGHKWVQSMGWVNFDKESRGLDLIVCVCW